MTTGTTTRGDFNSERDILRHPVEAEKTIECSGDAHKRGTSQSRWLQGPRTQIRRKAISRRVEDRYCRGPSPRPPYVATHKPSGATSVIQARNLRFPLAQLRRTTSISQRCNYRCDTHTGLARRLVRGTGQRPPFLRAMCVSRRGEERSHGASS